MRIMLDLAALSGGIAVPPLTAVALMAGFHTLTEVTSCQPDPDPTVIDVCGRDRVSEAQRLPLSDEVVYTGPRIPTGEMPSAAMAFAKTCELTG